MREEKEVRGILLVDPSDRFCEVGLFAATESDYGALILRRVLSLGSLWWQDEVKIPEGICLAVVRRSYEARTSSGFTRVYYGSCSPTIKSVAAVLDRSKERLETKVWGFQVALFPGGKLYLPQKQAIQYNCDVVELGKEFLSQQNTEVVHIVEGQTNTFQRAEIWPEKSCGFVFKFKTEHNEKYKKLQCVDWYFKRQLDYDQEYICWSGPGNSVERTRGQLNFYCNLVYGKLQTEPYVFVFASLLAAGSKIIKQLTGLEPDAAKVIADRFFDNGWRLKFKGSGKFIAVSPTGEETSVVKEVESEVEESFRVLYSLAN